MPETVTAPPAPAAPPNASGPNMAGVFAEFDSLVAAPEETQTETAPTETETAPEETQTATETKPADKPLETETKPADKKTDAEIKPTETAPKPPDAKPKAATLRESLTRAQTEATEWKNKYEKLAAETAKPKPDPEKEQLVKDREAWVKRQTELENELKFANYERSQEYKDKYQQPFLKALDQGGKLVAQLNYKEPDRLDEFGQVTETGKTRKATEADWESLMSIPDEETANKFIADHFGYSAARVAMARDKVLDLHNQMRSAIEDFRKQAGDRETQMRAQTAAHLKEISGHWHSANQHAAEKFPQFFAPDPADQKGNELLERGTRLTDFAFGVLPPTEFDKLPPAMQAKLVNGQLPQAELTLLHSAIRNRSAAHDRLVYLLNKEKTARAAAEKQLKDFEASEPKRGSERKVEAPGKKSTTPSTFAEIDAEFDRLAAGNG